jgi:hypothetical protein
MLKTYETGAVIVMGGLEGLARIIDHAMFESDPTLPGAVLELKVVEGRQLLGATLLIGFPLPEPLLNFGSGGKWYADLVCGKELCPAVTLQHDNCSP